MVKGMLQSWKPVGVFGSLYIEAWAGRVTLGGVVMGGEDDRAVFREYPIPTKGGASDMCNKLNGDMLVGVDSIKFGAD